MKTFTFICLGQKQAAGAMDVQKLDPTGYRRHALQMMHDHTGAVAVEVWCDDVVIDTVLRDGDWPRSANPGLGAA